MGTEVYVGQLPQDIREGELRDLFIKYGPIHSIELKGVGRPGVFAFINYEDPKDAHDAVQGLEGYDFYGSVLRVNLSHGARGIERTKPSRSGMGGDRFGGGRNFGRFDDRDRRRSRGLSRRTDYRVIVANLHPAAEWQDLKDHMRKSGEVTFADVVREGRENIGIVEFACVEDMHDALGRLDRSVLRLKSGEESEIRVRQDTQQLLRARPRSRSRDRGRDRSRSPYRLGAPQRSRGRDSYRGPVPVENLRRSQFRVCVTNLPEGIKWQDLKDHMKRSGPVIFSDVVRPGCGIVEYASLQHMQHALQHLDKSDFLVGGQAYRIRVREDRGQATAAEGSRGRSRGRDGKGPARSGSSSSVSRWMGESG